MSEDCTGDIDAAAIMQGFGFGVYCRVTGGLVTQVTPVPPGGAIVTPAEFKAGEGLVTLVTGGDNGGCGGSNWVPVGAKTLTVAETLELLVMLLMWFR